MIEETEQYNEQYLKGKIIYEILNKDKRIKKEGLSAVDVVLQKNLELRQARKGCNPSLQDGGLVRSFLFQG